MGVDSVKQITERSMKEWFDMFVLTPMCGYSSEERNQNGRAMSYYGACRAIEVSDD